MGRVVPQHVSASGWPPWRMTWRLRARGTCGICPGIICLRYVGASEGTGGGARLLAVGELYWYSALVLSTATCLLATWQYLSLKNGRQVSPLNGDNCTNTEKAKWKCHIKTKRTKLRFWWKSYLGVCPEMRRSLPSWWTWRISEGAQSWVCHGLGVHGPLDPQSLIKSQRLSDFL